MSGGNNTSFLRDPFVFIQNTPVDVTWFDKRPKGSVQDERALRGARWLRDNAAHLNKMKPIAFEFVTRDIRLQGGRRVHFAMARIARIAFPYSLRRTNERTFADFYNTDHPVEGYFFPYSSPPGGRADVDAGRWGIAQMGQVDFPRADPLYDFVFTGAMNGCAIVVTESPLGFSHYRAYHYPNPDSYPRFKDPNVWPFRVLHWFGFDRYCGTSYAPPPRRDEIQYPDGWNFLHFYRGAWHVYSQHHCAAVTSSNFHRSVMITSTERDPFRIRLSDLPDAPPPPRRRRGSVDLGARHRIPPRIVRDRGRSM